METKGSIPVCLGTRDGASVDGAYMHRGWRKSNMERAMTKVFQSPSALACMRTMICATCRKTAPCLGALFTLTSPWPVAV